MPIQNATQTPYFPTLSPHAEARSVGDVPAPANGIPPRIWQSILRSRNKAQQALDQLWSPWSENTKNKMSNLFTPGILTNRGKQMLHQSLVETLSALNNTIAKGGSNIYLYQGSNANPGQANDSGQLGINQRYYQMNPGVTDDAIDETMIHEHAHIGAKAKDNWYTYYGRPWGGNGAPVTLYNAVNNAQSIAEGVTALI